MDTRLVMQSLPLVAAVLGNKYGVTVNIGGKDASTNGRTINLPSLPAIGLFPAACTAVSL